MTMASSSFSPTAYPQESSCSRGGGLGRWKRLLHSFGINETHGLCVIPTWRVTCRISRFLYYFGLCSPFHLYSFTSICARNKTLSRIFPDISLSFFEQLNLNSTYLKECTFQDLDDWQPILRLNWWPSFWPCLEKSTIHITEYLIGMLVMMGMLSN